MTSPIGYNNPAYNHQFDSSLYEYQYVPEIDPEYDGHPDREQEQIHLVHPSLRDEHSGTSEEFDASDESNQSIIVEECNNRRVTLICDKRNKMEDRVYEDKNCKGAYHHNISLDSEEEYRTSQQEGVSLRHQRRLEPPPDALQWSYTTRGNTNHPVEQSNTLQCQRPERQHRYEELDDYHEEVNLSQRVSRHRYAEITFDENGYPSIGNEIEIERNENGYHIVNTENQRLKKPRAASPVNQSFPLTFGPIKTYHHPQESNTSRMIQTKPVPTKNVIEMAEMSPPKPGSCPKTPNHTQFFQSPKRQPPIGASSPAVLQEQMKTRHKRQGSLATVTPGKGKPSVTHMFQVRSTPKTVQTPIKSHERNSSRRNISYSFGDSPEEVKSKLSSPYRPTTEEMPKAKTAIITPILQRKNRGCDQDLRNLKKMFQSTGNLHKDSIAGDEEYRRKSPEVTETKPRIKRNRSVPNFAHSLANEGKLKYARDNGYHTQQKPTRNLDYQYSPAKSDRFSPIDRSRLSLIDQTKMSWSNSASDFHTPASGCLLIGAIIQIATSIVSCAICFYFFSKLGRRYYLDFGILAGFVNFVLGVLGFRSQCWKWLPNRNYVSGFILLTAFSIITCGGFIYLITARPMAGDPILDVMGGGICGISVLTIVLAITGLTMSGCCKTPPPDNRVNNI